MKVYVISDDKAKGANLYGIASASGCAATLSPNFYEDYKLVVDEVTEKKGLFDMIFVMTGSPMPLSMELNKIGWVRAVVCNNAEEAVEAREASANVVVMNSRFLGEPNANAIVKSMVSSKVKPRVGGQERAAEEEKEQPEGRWAVRKKGGAKDGEKASKAQREEDFDANGKKRPLGERLKRSLGLGDTQ